MGQMVIVETASMEMHSLETRWQMKGKAKSPIVRELPISPSTSQDMNFCQVASYNSCVFSDLTQPPSTRFAPLKKKGLEYPQQDASLAERK
jgi:hypothetical protein